MLKIKWENEFCGRNGSDASKNFIQKFLDLISLHVPNSTVLCNPKDPPWITNEVKKAVHRKRKAWFPYNRKGACDCLRLSQVVYNLCFHIILRSRDEPEGAAKVEQVQLFPSDRRLSPVAAGSLRLSQTSNDLCFHIKFEGAGDRSIAGSRSLPYGYMETKLKTYRKFIRNGRNIRDHERAKAVRNETTRIIQQQRS